MNKCHLVFVLLFLGGWSLLTGADENPENHPVREIKLNRTEMTEFLGRIIKAVEQSVRGTTKYNATHTSGKMSVPRTELGIAQIIFYQEGPICSGIHLKPWIVLTTADCIQDRNVNFLVVQVTYYDRVENKYLRADVEVKEVTTDPYFTPDEPAKNLALLYIYSEYDWMVDEFTLPTMKLTTQDFLNKNIKTYTDRWLYNEGKEKYYSVKLDKELTTDFGLCGELSPLDNFFCTKKNENVKNLPDSLSKVDVGIPLFYYHGEFKRLFALLSTKSVNKNLKGELYQSIYENMYWIDQYVHEHSLPPL